MSLFQLFFCQGFNAQIYQLFLLATSPPEMLSIMEEQNSFATRAICAMVLTLFTVGGKLFLYKLVIAASMRHFREEQTKTVGIQIENRRVALTRAFSVLTDRVGFGFKTNRTSLHKSLLLNDGEIRIPDASSSGNGRNYTFVTSLSFFFTLLYD